MAEKLIITSETTNYARLCNAVITVGADCLREILQEYVPQGYQDIYQAVTANMTQLKPLLTREQFRLLFPPSSQPSAHSVSDYDISLLYKLIRNISSLPVPQTGWGKPVTDHPRDVSLEANVERMRVLRNEIAGHSATGEMSQQDFNKYWAEVKKCVSDIEAIIGDVIYQQRLDSLKIADMDPDFVNREITAVRRIVQDIQDEQHKTGKDNTSVLQEIVTKQDVHGESLKKYIDGNNKRMSDLDEIKISLSNQGPRYDLKRIGKQIAQLYADKGECRRICINPLDQSSTEDITLVYTDLEIVTTDKGQSLYGRNNVETYDQFLFDQDGNLVKRIYLNGIGGTGKTTFLSRVVLDWTITTTGKGRSRRTRVNALKQMDTLRMFELCIPVPLYRVKEEDNLQDLIINCVIGKHHSVDINRLVRAMEVNQNRVLILLDGFDEYRGTSPVVQQIINGDRLAGCCVVITSRPYKIHEHGTKKIHRLIHLKGLNKTKIKEYIRKVYTYVLRHQSPEHEVNLLYEEIKNNSLKEVAKVPLILLFICYLRYWGQELPKRETEIYENMIKCLMAYYEGKLDRDRQGRTRRMLDSIDISKIRDVLVAVGSIGYSGLQKNNSPLELVFAVDDLNEKCDPTLIKRALQIGILAEMKDVSFLRDTTHVSFPHKTMQEFCAAFYLLQNEASDAFEEFLQNIDEISTAEILGNVAKFAVGMSNAAASKILNLIVRKLYENEGKHENSRFLNILFHLWSEANTDVYIKGTYLYFNDGTNSAKSFTHLFPNVFNQFEAITFEAVDEGVLYSAIKSLSRNRRWRKVQIKKATLNFDDYSEDLI